VTLLWLQLNELPPSELEKLSSDEDPLALSEFFQRLDFAKTSQGRCVAGLPRVLGMLAT